MFAEFDATHLPRSGSALTRSAWGSNIWTRGGLAALLGQLNGRLLLYLNLERFFVVGY